MSNRTFSKNNDATDAVTAGFAAMGLVFMGLLLFVGIFTYMVWASALVGSILWGWFITPFVGIALTKAQAWGIALLISFWTYHYKSVPIKDEREWNEKLGEVAGLFIYPWLVLLFGWICHTWFWTKPVLQTVAQ